MKRVTQEIIDGLRQFDTPTLFNALVERLGLPNEDYTSHAIRCLLPELGSVVGYAVTAEVTTNDADSPALDWFDYYDYLEQTPGPLVAVLCEEVAVRGSRRGYAGAEVGWTLADNHKINTAIERMGAQRTKVYRVYERAL